MLDKATARELAAKYASRVREEYDPKQVILFGSYINGEPHEYSDIDIAVIFEKTGDEFFDTWTHLVKLCRGVSLDIEPHMLDETCNQSGFLDHIRKTGEVI
ncbi:MAG: nucleotidyltransferase domain-containing protein [Defluviitaleaceae bacterium]|nr:nucleotidyltransferase domain-containing protein [Defluviitaleaceae bacterium]